MNRGDYGARPAASSSECRQIFGPPAADSHTSRTRDGNPTRIAHASAAQVAREHRHPPAAIRPPRRDRGMTTRQPIRLGAWTTVARSVVPPHTLGGGDAHRIPELSLTRHGTAADRYGPRVTAVAQSFPASPRDRAGVLSDSAKCTAIRTGRSGPGSKNHAVVPTGKGRSPARCNRDSAPHRRSASSAHSSSRRRRKSSGWSRNALVSW